MIIFIILCLTWIASVFLFMCFVNYLYELAHFKVEDGKLITYKVWWGKYFGYEP